VQDIANCWNRNCSPFTVATRLFCFQAAKTDCLESILTHRVRILLIEAARRCKQYAHTKRGLPIFSLTSLSESDYGQPDSVFRLLAHEPPPGVLENKRTYDCVVERVVHLALGDLKLPLGHVSVHRISRLPQ